MNFSPDAITGLLAARPSITIAEWEARPAAVLLPFFKQDGQWQLLFTERTHSLVEHRGQVAFPGGRADPEDATRIDTALREAEEEIGLARQDVTVLGILDELLTVTQYRVTPVVATIPWPYSFVTSPAEIETLFHAPLAWLADPANRETRLREPPVGGPPIPVYYFHFEGHVIWGVTARIVVNFLEVTGAL